MERRIAVLDPATANQIAAGEVVERPASVVKELVENAIDAGARNVAVHLEQGGKALIRVRDDGSGMSAADAVLAFERHATSKIRSLDDLESVASLGFRGEALPSIAAVARVDLLTRLPDALSGTRLYLEGGGLVLQEETGCAAGTEIHVRDLFYNTPARRKFLKSDGAELARIGETVSLLALAYPGIAFRLTHHATVLLQTPGRGDILDVLIGLYGTETSRHLIRLESTEGEWRVHGYLGTPEVARANRSGVATFVNGRPVRNQTLRHALEEAYRGLLPVQKYPLAILFFHAGGHDIDVNVHPAKLEVRFADERRVHALVYRAVRLKLHQSILIPGTETWSLGETVGGCGQAAGGAGVKETGQDYLGVPVSSAAMDWERRDSDGLWSQAPGRTFPALTPLAQFGGTYILATGAEGLYLVDQHAAHERVFYERLAAAGGERLLLAQELIVPIAVELTPSEWATWEEQQETMARAGFVGEDFGGRTVRFRSVPAFLATEAGPGLIHDVLNQLAIAGDADRPVGQRERAMRALAACRAAAKAGQSLAPDEMASLLANLGRAAEPFTCPHGRPTVVLISHEELARRFRRA